MDLQLNDHLKIDSEGRTLFHPIDFTSPGYLVPNERTKKQIVWMTRLCRFASPIAATIAIATIPAWENLLPNRWADLLASMALYFAVEWPLKGWWPRYANKLTKTLVQVGD